MTEEQMGKTVNIVFKELSMPVLMSGKLLH